ncbi:hypothetical protein [Arthrobacter sp. FW306-04-A]|uniref:hypothetical protein n=1 Tax=Arthrobacter sp. FW306-04-A TaxID=2879619 RepID=UPI0037C0BEEF|nr:hypothetical protein LFT43_02720 [Arthrobacter sp. FW306-04-A]
MFSASVTAIGQSLQLRLASIYLFLVSVLGIATVWGSNPEGAKSPVLELSSWWSITTGQSATWLLNAQDWINQRSEFFSGLSWVVVIAAALVLVGQGWRAVSTLTAPTLVLGVALGSTVGVHFFWQLGVAAGIFIVGFVLRRRIDRHGNVDSNDFGGVVIGVAMAFAYAPLLILRWLTGDAGSEQEMLKRRQVAALEKIAKRLPNNSGPSGARTI